MIQAAKIIGLGTTGLIGEGVRIGGVFGAVILGLARNPSMRGQLFAYVAMVLAYVILVFAFLEVIELLNAVIVFGASFLGSDFIWDSVFVNNAILIVSYRGNSRRHFSSSRPNKSDSENSPSSISSSSSGGEIDPTDPTKLDRTQSIADRYHGDNEAIEEYFRIKEESIRESHRVDSNNAAIDGTGSDELYNWMQDYHAMLDELHSQKIDVKDLASIPVTPDPSANLLGEEQEGNIEPASSDSHPTNEEGMQGTTSGTVLIPTADQGGSNVSAEVPGVDVVTAGPSRKRPRDEEDEESSPAENKRFKQDSSDVVDTDFPSYGWDSED